MTNNLNTLKNRFTEKIIELRESKGITMSDFASAIGVSRQAIYNYECGDMPKIEVIYKIAKFFKVNIFELFN